MAARDKLKQAKEEKQAREQEVIQKAASDVSAREVLKKRKKSRKKEHFLRLKMWVNYLVSTLEKDRGKIPDNIGNRILISNNLITTKFGMSTYIHIQSLSLDTPQCLISRIVEELRKGGSTAILDFVIKNKPYNVSLGESGMRSRISNWVRASERDDIPDFEKEIAARCLYTVDIIESGERVSHGRFFLKLTAKTGTELTEAEKIVYGYLNSIHAEYVPIVGMLKPMLEYITISSDRMTKDIKDVRPMVLSARTMCQLLPNSGSLNDDKGLTIGVNIDNYQPYKVDFENITAGRNLYAIAPSGGGKTVLALNLCESAVENGWAVSIQDIKGNEFVNFVKGTGGYIVSLRESVAGYINSFIMRAEETTDQRAETYFKDNLAFSKRQLMILSGLESNSDLIEFEELLDGFLETLYIGLGVIAANRSTWSATQVLTPFEVYDRLVDYVTPEIQAKYPGVTRKVFTELKMFLSKSGSKSYIFTEEFKYVDIVNAKTLMFDFGILDKSGQQVDRTTFRLKFEYMRKLNADFVSHKYKCGQKVLKILEESQIVTHDPEILKGYVEEYTLRRAQGQTTLLLGNSITALVENPIAQPLIENISAMFVSRMNTKTRDEVAKIFGLEQDVVDCIDELSLDEKYENAFLFINRMQMKSMLPVIKVLLDKNVEYKLLTPVSTSNVK